jgi:K+-transporting ATPase c subunit
LDPHITLANALYQAPRVAAARAKMLAKERGLRDDDPQVEALGQRIHRHLEKTLNQHAGAPLFGLAGVPLVNVLETNLALPGWVAEAIE